MKCREFYMLDSTADGVSLIIKLSFSIFAAHREALVQCMKVAQVG